MRRPPNKALETTRAKSGMYLYRSGTKYAQLARRLPFGVPVNSGSRQLRRSSINDA